MYEDKEYTCECEAVHGDKVQEAASKMPDNEETIALADFFKVFGDTTRVKIIWALDNFDLCVCDIANLLGMTKSAVSHQLAILRRARLVTCKKVGKEAYYSLADGHVRRIIEAGKEHVEE